MARSVAATKSSRAPALAERFEDKSATWRSAAIVAFELLPPEQVFEIGSPPFADPKRAKRAARARLDAFAWEVKTLGDPRWIPFLSERLAVEDSAKLRVLIVKALGKTGPGGGDDRRDRGGDRKADRQAQEGPPDGAQLGLGVIKWGPCAGP